MEKNNEPTDVVQSTVQSQMELDPPRTDDAEPTAYLWMGGLDFKATTNDIYHFFQNYNPIRDSIVLEDAGIGYVGFQIPADAERAREQLDHTVMPLRVQVKGKKNRWIKLEICYEEKVQKLLTAFRAQKKLLKKSGH